MSYVVAGYTIVLSILFLYAVALVARRRRLTGVAARVAAAAEVQGDGTPDALHGNGRPGIPGDPS